MTTETALKHLAWVGPATLFGLAYALKGFRWWVQNYKNYLRPKPAAEPTQPPPPVQPEAHDAPEPEPVPLPAPPLDVPLYLAERPDPDRLYSELLQQAMQAAVDTPGPGTVLTAAGQIQPDPNGLPGSLKIIDTRPLPDEMEDGRGVTRAEILKRQFVTPWDGDRVGPHGAVVHAMSTAERETRILGFTLYRTRLAAEAKAVERSTEEQVRAWATQKARDEFLTPAKRAEIAAAVQAEVAAAVGDLPVPSETVLADMQKSREEDYVTSVGAEAARMYAEMGLSPAGLVRGNLFAYKDDGSPATPASKPR